MKRYLAFATEIPKGEVDLDDFIGDFDQIKDAKAAVDKRDPDGMNAHEDGAVVDTATGEIRDWAPATGPFLDDRWYAPRPMGPR